MVLRKWVIEYFIGELDEVSTSDEIGFYVVMNIPVILFLTTILFIHFGR